MFGLDLFGLDASDVRHRFPEIYQHVNDHVRPEREAKVGRTADADQYARLWWLFAKPRPEMREALKGLKKYIATSETSKHRFFVFLENDILPDSALIVITSEDAYHLGILSSRIHVTWALAAGGRLGVGNDPRYNKTRCFDPFPEATEAQRTEIRTLGEQLDAHRKARQAQHPDLTLTDLYNVHEKLRAGEPLDEAERRIHDRGLVAILKELHDELDAAFAAA